MSDDLTSMKCPECRKDRAYNRRMNWHLVGGVALTAALASNVYAQVTDGIVFNGHEILSVVLFVALVQNWRVMAIADGKPRRAHDHMFAIEVGQQTTTLPPGWHVDGPQTTFMGPVSAREVGQEWPAAKRKRVQRRRTAVTASLAVVLSLIVYLLMWAAVAS